MQISFFFAKITFSENFMIIIFACEVSPSKISTKLAKLEEFHKMLRAFPESYTG